MNLKIAMIGSGNVASHLSKAFNKKGHQITQVYSRKIENAISLANKFGSIAISNLDLLTDNADIYIVAVSDSAIYQIVNQVQFNDKRVVHTAGSVDISVFNKKTKNCGVFYPLQTFSKNREIDFTNIPVCIESENKNFNAFLNELAHQISENVWQINSENRKILHLSAVFANNFVNHLYSLAEDILKEKKIPVQILHELIKETASKAVEIGSEQAQTGPAIRNDKESQKKHLDLLSSTPEFYKIYKLLSESICLKNS